MIIGHKRQLDILNSHIARGKLSHAYLFSGPEHVGKMTVAFEFAEKILPQVPHPDLVVIDAETIGIADIRELKDRAGRTAFGGGYKVFILNNIARMSREAANSLLKLLEEPLGQTLFILISSNAEVVLPTILSRVWHLKFWPVSEHIIEAYLETGRPLGRPVSKSCAKLLAAISFGRPGIALGRVEESESELEQEMKRLETQFKKSILGPVNERFAYAEKISTDTAAYITWYNEIIAVLRLRMRTQSNAMLVSPAIPIVQRLIQHHPQMLWPYTNKRLLLEAALCRTARFASLQ